MKEIIDLQARVIAHAPPLAEGKGLDFSRDETGGDFKLLSPELRGEIDALQRALNAAIPEDFEYFVFLGGDEGPFFGLDFERMPTGPEWDPDQSILDQLRPLDWEAAREQARASGGTMQEIMTLLERIERKPTPAKSLQRDYREELKDFVREKRRDAGKVHVLYLDGKGELLEVAFEDGEAFREMLPGMVGRAEEVFGIVANGKPLPVERIDALNAQAQRVFQERMRQEAADQEAEGQAGVEDADTGAGQGDLPI